MRRDARGSIDTFKRKLSNAGDGMKAEETLLSSLQVVDRARKQTIKYGMMCLLNSPHAVEDTEQGRKVRHNLKDVWGKHRMCAGIKDYLGVSLVARIEDMLESIKPKKAATASQTATAQGPMVKKQKS